MGASCSTTDTCCRSEACGTRSTPKGQATKIGVAGSHLLAKPANSIIKQDMMPAPLPGQPLIRGKKGPDPKKSPCTSPKGSPRSPQSGSPRADGKVGRRRSIAESQAFSPKASGSQNVTRRRSEGDDPVGGDHGGVMGMWFKRNDLIGGYSKHELLEAFRAFDEDNSGSIDFRELVGVLDRLNVSYTGKSVLKLLKVIADGAGHIERARFLQFFEEKDRNKKLSDLIRENLKQLASEDLVYDVFIDIGIDGQHADQRAWWVTEALEYGGFTCMGPHLDKAMYLDMHREAQQIGTEAKVDEENLCIPKFSFVEQCRGLVLLLDPNALVQRKVVANVERALQKGKPVCVLYEVCRGMSLSHWKQAVPEAFKGGTWPISRRFPVDSEQLMVQAVNRMLLGDNTDSMSKAPLVVEVEVERELYVEKQDFQTLTKVEGISWVAPEFIMILQAGSDASDLPKEAYGTVIERRPYYVSYPQEDPENPGPSQAQILSLREFIKRNRTVGHLFFIDQLSLNAGEVTQPQGFAEKRASVISNATTGSFRDVKRNGERRKTTRRPTLSVGGNNGLKKSTMLDVLLTSQIVIFDEVDPTASDRTPYLRRGQCFVEVTVALLTGNVKETRKGQEKELDNEIGAEFAGEPGIGIRRIIRENASYRGPVLNRLAELVQSKVFPSDAERAEWTSLLWDILSRHPLIMCAYTAGEEDGFVVPSGGY